MNLTHLGSKAYIYWDKIKLSFRSFYIIKNIYFNEYKNVKLKTDLFCLPTDDLQIDYQFTFNLSKQEDRHIRQINFFNIPTKPEVDTDFDILCSKVAKMKISAKKSTYFYCLTSLGTAYSF